MQFFVWVLEIIQNNFFCSSFKSFATPLFREFGCHWLLILAPNFKLRGINFAQIYWARLSNPSAPALFSCRQNSERCPQYFWEIVCSDLFARLVVQKVQILVRQQPLLALLNNRSVSDSFKFFHSSASSSIPCCHSKVPFFNAAENLCHRKLSFYNQMMTSFLAGKTLWCTWWIRVL